MGIRGTGVLAVALLLGGLTACTDDEDTAAPAARDDVAVPSYQAPPRAPDFCARLAGSRYVDAIPTAVGTLLLEPRDDRARRELSGAVAELEAVLDEVWREPRSDDLSAGMEDLLAALYSATANPVDEQLAIRIADRLDVVGERVQPVCEFPV
ncbi:hypothetical protein [Blastococcus deserti]|uniref:Uncharacterized protein n=1 Tax=Blastococcus deserti TaxID=2259033 RepID=A0ABW4X7K0_9ACTN